MRRGGQFKGTLLQYLPIVVQIIGILWKIFVFLSSIYIYCNEQLKFCQTRMNNVHIYILVSYDPLISNNKHGTRDAEINYIHAATYKPVECSQSKGGPGPSLAPHSSVRVTKGAYARRHRLEINMSSCSNSCFKSTTPCWPHVAK